MEISAIMQDLARGLGLEAEFERLRHADLGDIMRMRMDDYNRSRGNLDAADGYDCPLCLNRGYTCKLEERMGGIWDKYYECSCMDIRRNILRLRRSGLEQAVKEMTFEAFRTDEPWQKAMLDRAKRYLQDGFPQGRWFYAGGQPGCGKTHICTAIAGELLKTRPLLYMPWAQESKALKALVTDAEAYAARIGRLEEVDVLYIDDFLKPIDGGSVSAGDLKLAFELLNYRYTAKKPTILSSEWYVGELLEMDEATASRICERCGGNDWLMEISRDRGRNQRIPKAKAI